MFVESTFGIPGCKAILESPMVNFHGEACLHISIHMYGQDTGIFRIYINSSGTLHKLYEIQGPQGDEWIPLKSNIGHGRWRLSSNISFMFEATRGEGHAGDIANDDIKYIPGQCMKGTYS